ncbi:MAG: 4-hydroxy-3-methylbut-2-enyl diphosphate reductase [Desulfobacterales bacterium]|nr:4-hydroxy-3-methylbut-2-enyl diphosphate reductase [Desulfobacterales bacterium]
MKIIVAKTAGFCMGVRRAVEMVLDAPGKHRQPICTFGPLIHNPQVLELLEEKGMSAIDRIPAKGEGTVLIRAHGVPPETKSGLKAAGFNVIDATCPRVIKVQTIIARHARQNHAAIIIGNRDHPEVIGLLGYAGDNGHVVDNMADLDSLPAFDQAIIVAQTTQNMQFFESVKAWAAANHPHYKVFDTICDSTAKRQAEVRQLAGAVDAIVVVGGRNSGNTQRLAELARESGKPTYHIETEADLDIDALAGTERIGLTAGASTPHWIIRRVFRRLETIPTRRDAGWRRILFNMQRGLLLTNIYVAAGAGCLSYACSRLLEAPRVFPSVLVAVLYVLSMHLLNHLTGSQEDRYNDPGRAAFYTGHQFFLGLLAVVAGGAGLLTAYAMGTWPFFILLAMSLLGLSYNLRWLPGATGHYRRIKDIPGSKTILIALAWGVVTTVFPALTGAGRAGLGAAAVFFWATGMVFVRTAFFDLLDMQGDRIVGKETLPILFGEKKTILMLKAMILAIIVVLGGAGSVGLLPSLGYALAVCPVFIGLVVNAYLKGHMLPGIRLEFLVETLFVLTGLITVAWTVLGMG